jgi:beta-galactosidase
MKPLRAATPEMPITINMMGTYPGLNYWRFAPHIDVICWDSYPRWHCEDEAKSGMHTAFSHDINRSMKMKPFILMESSPSQTNWAAISPLKRPGMHKLSSLQAVAHGADSVMYFQWRKSRGSCEKFHGAVVDHVGHENTRVFHDVMEVGAELKNMDDIVGTTTPAEVGLIYDWENRWAIELEAGPRNVDKNYLDTCLAHYEPLWRRGIPVDVIDMEQDLGKYKLVVAPMLYMLRPGVAERIIEFVEDGGHFVATYFTGYADENDLCFQGGFPGPLRKVFGIWSEEMDALPDDRKQKIKSAEGNDAGLTGTYEASQFFELIHTDGATVLATYDSDFYATRPAVTVNPFGKGKAYYVASRNDARFIADLLKSLITKAGIKPSVGFELPEGVTATVRSDGQRKWVFAMNFRNEAVELPNAEKTQLKPYDIRVLNRVKG